MTLKLDLFSLLGMLSQHGLNLIGDLTLWSYKQFIKIFCYFLFACNRLQFLIQS